MVKLSKVVLPIMGVLCLYFFLVLSFSKVNLIIDDQKVQYWTKSQSVGDVLEELGVDKTNIVKPDLTTNITDGSTIQVIKVKEETVIVEEEIPYATEYTDDEKLLTGHTRIVEQGENGLLTKTFLVKYLDGREASRQLLAEKIIQEPVARVIARGTKATVQRSGKSIQYKKVLLMNATAYTHTGNKTFTGVWPKRGTVAVDPKVIPLGTRLYIDGYGYAVAEDQGSAIKGNRIDLFLDSKAEALKWGRKQVRVFVLD